MKIQRHIIHKRSHKKAVVLNLGPQPPWVSHWSTSSPTDLPLGMVTCPLPTIGMASLGPLTLLTLSNVNPCPRRGSVWATGCFIVSRVSCLCWLSAWSLSYTTWLTPRLCVVPDPFASYPSLFLNQLLDWFFWLPNLACLLTLHSAQPSGCVTGLLRWTSWLLVSWLPNIQILLPQPLSDSQTWSDMTKTKDSLEEINHSIVSAQTAAYF